MERWRQAEAQGGLAVMDIILSTQPGNMVAESIREFSTAIVGRPAEYSHAMRYAGHGLVLSQNWVYRLEPLSAYKESRLKFWHCTAYSQAQRALLTANAYSCLGGHYDALGIAGQAVSAIPGLKWMRRLLQDQALTYCSERVCLTERTINPGFLAGLPCQITPAEIDFWLQRQPDWQSFNLDPGENFTGLKQSVKSA